MEKFTELYSAVVLGTGNNNGINLKGEGQYVFKSYYKLRTKGKNTFTLFYINEVESTGNCRLGKKGDGYEIVSAYAAFSPDKEIEEDITPITFSKKAGKSVLPGEEYKTDSFEFDYKEDGYMVLSFTVKFEGRAFLPATNECVATGKVFENGKEIWCDNFTLRPCFIGVDKVKTKTVGFFGDSITQGTRTSVDKYEAWAHRIGNSLDESISMWNIGMGWSRAYDAVADATFLQKAALCDEVFICFGVNDIRSGGCEADEVINNLKKTKELLLKRNENIVVHFLTIPPFNMSVFEEEQRKKVNDYIRSTEGYFDIAVCLEADENGTVREEYMVNSDDSHPNGLGGEAVYKGFKIWQEKNAW